MRVSRRIAFRRQLVTLCAATLLASVVGSSVATATVIHNPPWADSWGNKWPGANGLDTRGSSAKLSKIAAAGYTTFQQIGGTAEGAMASSNAQSDAVWAPFGHGGPGYITWWSGTVGSVLNASSSVPGSSCSSPNDCISDYSTSQLHGIRVAVFGGCDTGEDGNAGAAYHANLVDYSYSGRGVDSALGFTALVYWPAMDSWSDAFFISLRDNNTVSNSYFAGRDRVFNDYGQYYGTNHVRLLGGAEKITPAGYGS